MRVEALAVLALASACGDRASIALDAAAPAHCLVVGTWDTAIAPPASQWTHGPSAVGLFPSGSVVEVVSVGGCSFSLMFQGETKTVRCTVQDFSVPLKAGSSYLLTTCATTPSVFDNHDFFVLRDLAGALVLAAGTGVDLVTDVSCLPAELGISLVDDQCAVLSGHDHCGARRNIGLRVTRGAQEVEVWSGQQATLTFDELQYDVRNFYSFNTVDWDLLCSDQMHRHMSWVIARSDQL